MATKFRSSNDSARLLSGARKWTLAAACLGFMAAPAAADAASPTVVIASAPLVDPTTALTTYGTPASPAAAATRDPLIQERARALKYDVDLIYEHVRDNVELLPMFGLLKGGRGVAIDGYGTPFDQAQFMVDALREADAAAAKGYNPRYILGKVTLSAAGFSGWTGIGDATLAVKYLANAGIPATVTGTGSSFTVTMLHIWVQATISGTNYIFDPSFKTSTQQAGLAWQASTGFTRADLLAAGASGTATSVNGFGIATFRSKLGTYRTGLENFIAANAAGKRAEAVVGTSRIVPHTSTEDRRTSLPYVASTDRTWTGEIPNVYRTSFTVSLNGSAYGTYFADTVGGKVVGFSYLRSGSIFIKDGELPLPIVAGPFDGECEEWLGSQPSAGPATVTVAINHPYVANAGMYSDRTLSRQIARQQCDEGVFYVSNDWGYVSDSVSRRLGPAASLIRADPQRKTDHIFAPTLAGVASQYSALLDLASRAQGSVFQLHDLVGIHTIDNATMRLNPGTYDTHSFLSMSFESAVSAFSRAGTAAADTAAAWTAGLGLSIIEAAVPRQEADAVYDMAALNLVTQQDSRASNSGTYTTYLATPSTWSSVQGSLSDYPSAATSAINGYVTEGYSLIIPQKGALRQPRITVVSVATRESALWEGFNPFGDGGELKRSAFLAFRPGGGAGSAPDRLTVSIYDQRRGSIIKAGVGVAAATGSGNDPIRKPEPPKAEGKDLFRAALNVDPRSGATSYAPAADLIDGSGDFPQSLDLRRIYDSQDLTNYGLGSGWKSNWYQVATLSNDGQAALGRSGSMGVSSALVMLQAVGDLVTTQDARHLYAALQTAAWFTDQTINNTVVVNRGLDSPETFYQRASGSYHSGRPDGATLTKTGVPETGIINRRLYLNHTLTYTDGSGSARGYASSGDPAGRDLSSPGISQLFARKSMNLATWNFPNGVRIKAGFTSTVAASDVIHLYRVTSNLGNAIYRSGYDYGSATDEPVCRTAGGLVVYDPPRPAFIKYRTAASQATFYMDAQVGWQLVGDPDNAHCPPGSTTPARTQFQYRSGLNSVTDRSGYVWNYSYVTAPGLFGAIPVLGALYKPSSVNPDIQLSYGFDGNARSLTNARGAIWKYHSTPYRSEVITPLQTAANIGTVTYFDRDAQPARSVNPLGHASATTYDDRGRPTEVTQPEGDRTITAYDVRGNVTSETRRAKSGTGLADLVKTTTYVAGPTVTTCTTPATCNRPSSTTDPRGFRTNFAWVAATGNLLSTTSGLNSASACQIAGGVCPVTSFTYTSLAGYDPFLATADGTLALLATKQVTIASANVTTTAYNWLLKDFTPAVYTGMTANPVKKIQIDGVVVDSGGLNLGTCYLSDLTGNVIAVTEPKGSTTCP